jgi:hypothetical protein
MLTIILTVSACGMKRRPEFGSGEAIVRWNEAFARVETWGRLATNCVTLATSAPESVRRDKPDADD